MSNVNDIQLIPYFSASGRSDIGAISKALEEGLRCHGTRRRALAGNSSRTPSYHLDSAQPIYAGAAAKLMPAAHSHGEMKILPARKREAAKLSIMS